MENKTSLIYENEYIKISIEYLITKLRTNKKLIEKEISLILMRISQIKKKISEGKITLEIENLFEIILKRLNQLEVKQNEIEKEEIILYDYLFQRINNLIIKENDYNYISILSQKKLNYFFLEFFIKENFINSANKIIEEENIQDSIEMKIFMEFEKIYNSIQIKDLNGALNWCNSNKSKLQKINSNLKFKILKQNFIEIFKSKVNNQEDSLNNEIECINFLKKNIFTEEFDKDNEIEIKNLLCFITINRNFHSSIKNFSNLLSEDYWNQLLIEFKRTYFNCYNMKTNSSLEQYFICGIIGLKTPFCCNKISFEEQCPVCNSEVFFISKDLPITQHGTTTLLCKKTRLVMDSNNLPLATKEGYLFSSQYIKNLGQISNENFKKVFIV